MRKYEKMQCNALTKTEMAYIAGLIDADGSVQIARRSTKGRWIRYALEITVSNTDTRIINYLRTTVGGGTAVDVRHFRKTVCFSWVITGNAAMQLLTQVQPYMQSKKDEAELAIGFQQLRGQQGKHRTNIEKEIDETLYRACRRLKADRGIKLGGD